MSDPLPEQARGSLCAACGSPLADDQEWCLECGAARTMIRTPPDPRIGLAIVAAVVAAVAIVLVIVLS